MNKELLKYFSFEGRTPRSEFWGIQVALVAVGFFVGFMMAAVAASGSPFLSLVWFVIGIATLGAAIVLTFACLARRARDAGLTPWWALALLIPYVSVGVLIVIGCLKTEDE